MAFRSGRGWFVRACLALSALGIMAVLVVVVVDNKASDNKQSPSESGSTSGPLLIGISAAKSGAIAPYDIDPGLAFETAIDEINAKGGILGRQVEVKWLDTKSDRGLSGTNAADLLDEGAVAIVTSCDFDYGSPAAIQASGRKVPSFSLCATAPKFGDRVSAGPYAYTMGAGTDINGSASAEWVKKSKPDWKRVYIMQDNSIEFSKSLGAYFKARWLELGGEIAGEDSYISSENVNVRAQITRMAAKQEDFDFIEIPGWLPGGGAVIRQIRDAGIDKPILSPSEAIEGPTLTQVTGKVSDVWTYPLICMPSYCNDGPDASQLTEFEAAFKAKAGHSPTTQYPVQGYNLAYVLKAGIEAAKGTDGTKVVEAIDNLQPLDLPGGPIKFTSECHKPQPVPGTITVYQDGVERFVESYQADKIAETKEVNPCR